ncbi:MAG TPA: DUF4038 domain-containing protein, partial [Thermoanaerobaculia bacterium]|nr:DUF4038 domain-containing protein [Thermoanaerobaculia bacterium]
HQFSGGQLGANFYGDAPFTGKPFTTPNEAYFEHVDDVVAAAAQRHVLLLLDALYLGFGCGNEGWCAEVKDASLADLHAWGQYVGQRYEGFANIVWVVGGDTDPGPVAAKVREFVAGLRERDTRHLITAHNQPESFAVTPWPSEAWLGVNNIYSYSLNLYQNGKTAYDRTPAMPFFLIESKYEGESGASPQRLRAEAYYPVLSGGMGAMFGDCPIWPFSSPTAAGFCTLVDWKTALGRPGSLAMQNVQRLFTSRAWQLLVPDWDHTVMTAGFGSWGSSDYAMTARTAGGATVIAYLPSKRTVTIDLSTSSGAQAKAWWYEPAGGIATAIGTFATSGPHDFTPPVAGDWVLVVDDAALGLPPPGFLFRDGFESGDLSAWSGVAP